MKITNRWSLNSYTSQNVNIKTPIIPVTVITTIPIPPARHRAASPGQIVSDRAPPATGRTCSPPSPGRRPTSNNKVWVRWPHCTELTLTLLVFVDARVGGPAASTNSLARFCHECGAPFPGAQVRFCCECGVKRLFIWRGNIRQQVAVLNFNIKLLS